MIKETSVKNDPIWESSNAKNKTEKEKKLRKTNNGLKTNVFTEISRAKPQNCLGLHADS